MPFLLLLFPDGPLPSPRWRFLAWTIVAAAAIVLNFGTFLPGESVFAPVVNPFGARGTVGGLVVVFVVLGVRRLPLCLALAVVLHGRPSWEIE